MRALLLVLALAGCQPLVSTPAPATYAGATVLDEKGAIGAEKAFTFAAKAATVAIRSGLVSDPARLTQIEAVRGKAYAALLNIRRAYRAGNATSYAAAFAEFDLALTTLNELF